MDDFENYLEKDMFAGRGRELQDRETRRFLNICESCEYPLVDLSRYKIPKDVLSFIPERIARSSSVIPLAKRNNILTVAVCEANNLFLIDNIRLVSKLQVAPVLAKKTQIVEAIDNFYAMIDDKEGAGQNPEEVLETLETEDVGDAASFMDFADQEFDVQEVTKLSKDTYVIDTVNMILSEALKLGTSDIHIEPYEHFMRVRFRVDGVLQEIQRVEKKYQEAVIARFKLMARLDITQRYVPQDGRFSFKAMDKAMDVRTSVLPIDFGEKIVLRLLDKEAVKIDVSVLGLSPYATQSFDYACAQPFGMILITGPTGSGKTTTLYTFLNRMNTIDRNIMTIEDPVEYALKGVTQVPVRNEIGMGFSHVLRSCMRQSPDIIMIGEMRDLETVDIAMKAALTGHLVFSTLHTNDAPSAVDRLLNMGVEPFLIASSLTMIAAQRLVRKICPNCKEEEVMDLRGYKGIPEEFQKDNMKFFKGKGCLACNNTGYKGRAALVEALVVDDAMRDLILQKASKEELATYAKSQGMRDLREDALDKCLRGETTFEEVLRVTASF